MKKLGVLSLVLAMALMLAVPAFAGKDDLKGGFLGVAWGSSPSDLKNKTAMPDSGVADLTGYVQKDVTIGGLKVDEVQYIYYKDKFTQAMLVHSDLKALTAALTKEFGAPDMEQADGMTNWVVMVDANNSEMVTIGVVPQQGVGAVVNTKYFMIMAEGMSGK